jgi:hypothetical protein
VRVYGGLEPNTGRVRQVNRTVRVTVKEALGREATTLHNDTGIAGRITPGAQPAAEEGRV